MPQRPVHRIWPGVMILGLHAAGACVAWWLLPGGFPPAHPRFWVNQVLPWIVVFAAGVGICALWQKWQTAWQGVLYLFPAAWIAGAISFRIVFPISGQGTWWAMLVWGIWLGSLVRRMNPGPWPGNRLSSPIQMSAISDRGGTSHTAAHFAIVAMAMLAAAVGGLVPLSQRGPSPSTTPANDEIPKLAAQSEAKLPQLPIKLRDDVLVVPVAAAVKVQCSEVGVTIHPLLTFISKSPDRCWSALASRPDRESPQRKITAGDIQESSIRLAYQSDVTNLLTISAEGANGPVSIDAYSQIEQPIYSHLNAFCDIEVSGFRKLSLSFSPCADELVEVTVSDYPVGRPSRLAFVDSAGEFQVVEASSGEKGPFRRLAAGQLGNQPLVMMLHDGDQILCRITLEDWSRQTSRDLSPTAGWGLPMNAIEFSRLDTGTPGTAAIWITLAGTSVGRGWDTVGHTAGTYRNRMQLSAN